MIRNMGYLRPIFKSCITGKTHKVMNEIEIRKVQAYTGERSLTIVLPKIFSEKLGIDKGDFLKVRLEDSRLVLEKADF